MARDVSRLWRNHSDSPAKGGKAQRRDRPFYEVFSDGSTGQAFVTVSIDAFAKAKEGCYENFRGNGQA
jgi:hypothetical protein